MKAGDQWVSATLAEPTVASRLTVEIGSPLLQIERIIIAGKTNRLSIWKFSLVPRYFKLHMRLGPERADLQTGLCVATDRRCGASDVR